MKKMKYIVVGVIVICFLVGITIKINSLINDRAQEQAVKQTEHYLAENYPQLKYEIQGVDSDTDYGHHGNFKHAVTVQNTETMETFDVYYDKNIAQMEDSFKLEKIEDYLIQVIQPQIENYVVEHFGEPRYVYVTYYIELGKPMIVVTFNENQADITQNDFDTFVAHLQQNLGLDHANVIVDYWMRESSFNLEY